MPCIQGEAKELGETNTRLPTMVYGSHSSKETCNALPALVTVGTCYDYAYDYTYSKIKHMIVYGTR